MSYSATIEIARNLESRGMFRRAADQFIEAGFQADTASEHEDCKADARRCVLLSMKPVTRHKKKSGATR